MKTDAETDIFRPNGADEVILGDDDGIDMRGQPEAKVSRFGRKNEGSVLLVALFVAAIGTYIVTTFLRAAILEAEISERDFCKLSALNLAEAGAESAVLAANESNWTGWTLSGNDATRALAPIDIGSGMTGNVTVQVQDKDFDPSIISESRINLDSGISIRRQIEVELRPRSLFASGAVARDWVYFYKGSSSTNTVRVDSYDSADGPYDPFLNRKDGGSVGGDRIYCHSKSRARIYGYLGVGNGNSYSLGTNGKLYGTGTAPGVKIDTERLATDFGASFEDEAHPGGGVSWSNPGTSVINLGNTAVPEIYRISGDMTINSSQTLRIKGDVTLIIGDDFSVYGRLVVRPEGELNVYVRDDIRTNYSTRIRNQTESPEKLRIFSTAINDSMAYFRFKGSGSLYLTIYAPRAYIDFYGNGTSGNLYGSVIGRKIVFRGNFKLHYDEQLKSFAGDGPTYTIEQWRELGPTEFVDLVP